jgi:DNA-binding transcriptional LysR family regulator
VSLFKNRYPDVDLSLTEGEPEDTVPELKRGEFDLAVVFDYAGVGQLEGGLDCIHLLDDALLAVIPADHPLARKRKIPLEELADEPWVGGCGGGFCNAMLVRCCNEAGFEPGIAFESSDHNVLMGLVAAGVGVTLLPELATRVIHPGVAIRPLTGPTPLRNIYAATPADSYRSPATEAMIEVLKEVAGEFKAAQNGAAKR